MTAKLQSGDALLIVDVQKDFCARGKLEVPKGDSVVPILPPARVEAEMREAGAQIVASA